MIPINRGITTINSQKLIRCRYVSTNIQWLMLENQEKNNLVLKLYLGMGKKPKKTKTKKKQQQGHNGAFVNGL